MKTVFFILLIFLSIPSLAQVVGIDSLFSKTNPTGEVSDQTLKQRESFRIDSLYSDFVEETDSLKAKFQSKLSELTASKSHLQHLSDSLLSINLPTDKVSQKIDSLIQKQQKLFEDLNAKIQNLKDKTIGRIKELDLPEGMQTKVSGVLESVEDFKSPRRS